MLTKINTATLNGIDGSPVVVETDIGRGLPAFNIVGLADTTIKESCKRIRPAILNSGIRFPDEKVTVNLVPAGKPKEGSHFDLPIAVGIITAALDCEDTGDMAFMGEVSLDGKLNRINGALPLVMSLRKNGIKQIVVPRGNAEEVAILEDVDILPASCLIQVIDHISGKEKLPPYHICKRRNMSNEAVSDLDFEQVIGQETAKRAVTIGAAGNHGVLMMGGPGCGKTMIAKRIPTILPELTYEEKLEITGIYSVAGLLGEKVHVIEKRPFRSPHHTSSSVALLGGGRRPKPGEISLAHRGVLFLDEFGEFESRVIDVMRQPIEDGFIRINKNLQEVVFPAKVMLVVAANPCKCGNLWDDKRQCVCTGRQIENHMRKLTGPFSDRIDIHIKMSPVSKEVIEKQESGAHSISSAEMRRQVLKAVEIQKKRYYGTEYINNGSLDEKGISLFCRLDGKGKCLINMAYEKMGLTMRGYNRLLKVSRTIADIEGEDNIREEHVAEALMYRVTEKI